MKQTEEKMMRKENSEYVVHSKCMLYKIYKNINYLVA